MSKIHIGSGAYISPRWTDFARVALWLSTAALLATLILTSAQAAMAAEPNNQACLGSDFSGYAQGGEAFGGFMSGLATGTGGVGNEIQAHQAGLIPDTVIPNTCND